MEKNTKVIALVGMPGSGKGTCTDYLHETYGWPVVHFGTMVYEEVQRRGLDNVKDEKFVREDMRKSHGKAVLAIHAAKKIAGYRKAHEKIVLIDGLYSWSEYKYLDETYNDDLIVIAVTAPKKARRQRVLARRDAHRHYTLAELVSREIAEIENLEKGGPIAYADYTLTNAGTPEKLLARLDKLLHEIGILTD